MFANHRIGALLLMAGEGVRFGNAMPKQFQPLLGKKIFLYPLETLLKTQLFDEIILVCHPSWFQFAKEVVAPQVKTISGGKTRQESSFLGLKAFSQKPDIVLIHDAVRPFLTEKIIQENITCAIQFGAVNTCIASADTLVHAPEGKKVAHIPRRDEYLRGQTPQTFRMDWILEAHEKALNNNASDDCQLILRIGKPLHVAMGSEENIKITTELDLFLAEQILKLRPTIASIDFDVH